MIIQCHIHVYIAEAFILYVVPDSCMVLLPLPCLGEWQVVQESAQHVQSLQTWANSTWDTCMGQQH